MEYLIHIFILIGIYGILAISLNLVVGYTGLLSITHAVFHGVGAYVVAILLTRYGLNFFVAAAAAVLITVCVSAFIGFVLSRFRDDFYALGSFGFNIIAFGIMLNWQSLTRGPFGIPGITRPELLGFSFSENLHFLVLLLATLALVYIISQIIVKSSFGRVLQCIREDEQVVQVLGYKTHYYKLAVFIFSAVLASIAGAFFASYISFIDPSSFALMESIFILAMIILGGLANNKGALVGVIILIILPEALRFVGFPSEIAAQMRQVIYGLMLVLMMLYRPQGFLGKYKL